MATKTLTLDQMREAVNALAAHGATKPAADALGIPRQTFQHRIRVAAAHGIQDPSACQPEELPPSDLPFEERLETIKRRNAQRIAHEKAKSWQVVRVPISGPYGLMLFGDPHLDDNFCDLEALERDARLCADTPGMFGVNGGDSINNWVGRLERIYAEQSVTAEEGWQLIDWFMNGFGIRWALWLLGNHDVWNFGQRVFDRMNTDRILMRDWDAKIVLRSDDGDCRLWARHDFKGTSIYNELHGLKKAAMFTGKADIYAAFHRHTWATMQGELDDGERFCLVRARGYKECDDYAVKNGFSEQSGGQSVVCIVEPRKDGPPRVTAFEDVKRGCEFLTYLRGEHTDRRA